MANIVHQDYETFSCAVLKKVGAYRYAADASTRVLMLAISLNGEEPRLLFPTYILDAFGWEQDQTALEWYAVAQQEDTLNYAHNAQFEIAISQYRQAEDFGLAPPPLHTWRCTSAMARMAALPSSLEDVAKVLGLTQQKDTAGKALIKLFSEPQRVGRNKGNRVMPWDFPEKFSKFADYCLQDVRVEKEVHTKLTHFDFNPLRARTFKVDTHINHRGIPVNVDGLRKAQRLIDLAHSREGAEFHSLTGLTASQNIAVRKWFNDRGYTADTMEAVAVERALADTSWATDETAVRALKLKQSLSYSACAKVATMLNCECGDGLVRGTLQYYGAGPGRWAGRLIQPQNFKRPTLKDTVEAYRDLCRGAGPDEIELLYGPVLEVIASCIRHFMQCPGGQGMLDADYSSIEARGVCWLAGQQDALDRYFLDEDAYIDMASFIFNVPVAKVSKDQRWLGKQTVLGCGYQMGWRKFLEQCIENAEKFRIKGISVDTKMAMAAVAAFRAKYDKVAKLWDEADRAAKCAVRTPGKPFKAGPHLTFTVLNLNGIPYLCMRLPSGRSIVYPWPKIEKTKMTYEVADVDATLAKGKPVSKKETKWVDSVTFYGKVSDNFWGRVSTYGGKLVENATQGLAADIMGNGAANALEDGYDIITLIHDQALAADTGLSLEGYIKALTTLPAWAKGLPIKADGKQVPFYLKL